MPTSTNTQNILPLGTVVSIPERKKTIYKITEHDNARRRYIIRRCCFGSDYPIAGDRTSYVYDFSKTSSMTVIALGTGEASASTVRPSAAQEVPLSVLRERCVPSCILDTYRMIECSLSPENLCCDGELPEREARNRAARLSALKKALDAYLGFNVRLDY